MFDDLKSNELKFVYPIVGIIVLLTILSLVYIWWPSNKYLADINKIEIKNNYTEIQKEKYSNILKSLLNSSNFDILKNKISNEWKSENGLTTDESLEEYLFKNMYISPYGINISNIQTYTSDEICIFKYTIDSNGKTINVSINEKAPYDYDITFDDKKINSLSNLEYNYEFRDINYFIKTKYASDSLIQYNIKVTSNSDYIYEWLLKENDKVELHLSDGTIIKASDMTAMGINTLNVSKGTTFDFDVTFNVSLDNQSKIESIVLNNTYLNGNINSIVIPLNGGE